MCWKIRDFVFCRNQQTLTCDNRQVFLEPLVVQVLDYFCQHPNRLISREQLIEEIWQARAISDNAVSRVIAKLRKLLNDNPRAPQYIATFPKKGYRFIAPVSRISPKDDSAFSLSPERNRMLVLWGLIVFGLAVACGWWFIKKPQPSAEGSLLGVQVLTRGGGDETMPAVSPDGQYMVYAEMIRGRMHLFLKDLHGGDHLEIGQQSGWNGPASWSSDGKRIVYLNTTQTQSQYFLQEVDGLRLGRSQQIHQAPAGSAGKMIFTHHPNTFVFAERSRDTEPYVLYLLELPTKTIQRLPQPPLIMAGNGQFDLHPAKNELLISSPNAQHWLDCYSLDLERMRLDHLFELQEFTCCAIWDHAGDGIVMKGSYPAQTMVRFDRTGKQRRELLRVPFRVSTPARFPNGKDYIFSGGRLNRDLFQVSFQTLERKVMINSSVDDRLSTLSPDGRQLAYISERSGSDEIWLFGTKDSKNRKLTQFVDGRHYFDLAWSPDGSSLAGVTINEIHIIDATVGRSQRLDIDNPMIRGISWKDNDTLAFSLNSGSQWWVHYYNIVDQQLTQAPEPWAFVRFAFEPNDTLWVHENGAVFYGVQQKPLSVALERALLGRRFTVLKKGHTLFYLKEAASGFEMIALELEQNKQRTLYQLDYPLGFDVGEAGIFFSDLKAYSRDIYRSTQP